MQDTDQIREKYWQGHISSWKKSSVGIREYCQNFYLIKNSKNILGPGYFCSYRDLITFIRGL
jgi:hypothetical protein